jgi:hypothetical protein
MVTGGERWTRHQPTGGVPMGIFDKLKGLGKKAGDLAEEHEDKIVDGIDKAADMADDKTGGKHADKIDKGADKAKDAVRKLGDS